MKRIAFLGSGVHTIPTYRALLNELSRDFEITVFSEIPIGKFRKEKKQNYRLVSGAFKGLSFRLNNVVFFCTVLWHHLFSRYHIIHAHSTYPTGLTAVIMQKMFGTPAIVSLDGGEGVYVPDVAFGDFRSKRRTQLSRWLLKRASLVNTLTIFHREIVERNLKITRPIHVIPRGVDLSVFSKKEDVEIQHPVRFICVGYFSPIKDHYTLLEAFQKISQRVPSVLTLVGEDYLHGEIQKHVTALGIANNVTFLKTVDHDEIAEVYHESDILMLTSMYESQAMVVMEALAKGLLVCGTNVGIMSDLSDKCCVTVPVGNSGLLAEKVISLIHDQQQMKMMRRNADTWCADHSLQKTATRWSEIYNQLIEQA